MYNIEYCLLAVLGDKAVMRMKRDEAIRLAQERATEAVKEAAEKKREADKYAVQEMMKV